MLHVYTRGQWLGYYVYLTGHIPNRELFNKALKAAA
jgi:hypothetical protein